MCPNQQWRFNMTIEAVLFDFGRVLGNFDKKKAWKRLSVDSCYSPEKIGEIIAAQNLEKMLESGSMSPTAFANELLYHTKSNLTVPHVMRIWGDIFTPNTVIEPYIDQLMERRVRLGVLSNTNRIHVEYFRELPLLVKLKQLSNHFACHMPSPFLEASARVTRCRWNGQPNFSTGKLLTGVSTAPSGSVPPLR